MEALLAMGSDLVKLVKLAESRPCLQRYSEDGDGILELYWQWNVFTIFHIGMEATERGFETFYSAIHEKKLFLMLFLGKISLSSGIMFLVLWRGSKKYGDSWTTMKPSQQSHILKRNLIEIVCLCINFNLSEYLLPTDEKKLHSFSPRKITIFIDDESRLWQSRQIA